MNKTQFVLNYASLFMLLVLTTAALDSTWLQGPLYARIQLNLLYNTHGLSVLAICVSAFYLAFVKKDGLAVGVFASFGIASIHELSLDAVDFSINHIGSGIEPKYALYLFGFLGVGYFISKRYHREVWLWAAGMLLSWYLLASFFNIGSSTTLDAFTPSKDFYNPLTNFMEVASWLVPASLWLLPRRWFSRQA